MKRREKEASKHGDLSMFKLPRKLSTDIMFRHVIHK
jgi:hypothetical protein